MPIALVTDSNSQLPPELLDRYGVVVVPIPVTVDGVDYLEGVDLDADGFYELFANGTPQVATSQPSPGAFAQAYEQCAAAGFDEVVSIHVGADYSGTLNSARLGADLVDLPVHLVDSGTLSFGVGCCVWNAGRVLAEGGSAADAVQAAAVLGPRLQSVTALGAAELLRASGRFEPAETGSGIDVYLAGLGGTFDSVGSGGSVDEVCDLMATTMTSGGEPIRVALGVADQSAAPYYQGLESRLADRPDVVEIVRYRIGPSVGAFTGLGTAGGFWW